jgi:hypothetical protein
LPKKVVGRIKVGLLVVVLGWFHFFTPDWAQGLYDYVKYFLGIGLLLWAVTFPRTVRAGVLFLYSIFGAFTYFLVWALSVYLNYRGEEYTFADLTAVLVFSVLLLALPLYLFFFHSSSGRAATLLDGFAMGSFSGIGYLFVQLYQEQLARGPIFGIPPGSWTTTVPTIVPTSGEPVMVFYATAIGWAGVLGFAIALARRLKGRPVWWQAIPLVLALVVTGEVVFFGLLASNRVMTANLRTAPVREAVQLTPEQVATLDARIAELPLPEQGNMAALGDYRASEEAINLEVLTPEQEATYRTVTRPARLMESFYKLDGSGRGTSRLYLLCFLAALLLGEVVVARGLAKHPSLRLEGEPQGPTALSELHLVQQALMKGRAALTAVDAFISARRRLATITFDQDVQNKHKDADARLGAAVENVKSKMLLVHITRDGQPLPESADGDKGVSWTKFTSGLVFTLVMAYVSMRLIVLLGVFFSKNLGDVPAAYMYAATVVIALGYVVNHFRLSIASWASAIGRKLLALFGWRLDD